MSSARSGSVIGAGFGLIFILVNTGSLPVAVAVLFRVVAVVAFVAVLIAVVVARRRPATGVDRSAVGGRRSAVSPRATGLSSWPRSGPSQPGSLS